MPHDNNSSSIYQQTMKMKLCILITWVLLCLPDSCLALIWISTPGEMLACTGDDVTFHWKYDTQGERVTMIFIINAQTETTFLTYYIDDDYSKTSDEYRGRTEFIEYSQEGTKFILKSVTKADSVGYIIQLGGIGEKNLANLKVYERPELKPTLRVNNKPHEFDQPLNLTSNEVSTVMLSTAQSVPANISISVNGDIVITCTRTTACVHSLSDNTVEDIGFEVDYGVCGVITEVLAVVSDEEIPSLISPKVENSESKTTEQSDEMTTFVTGHGDSNQATAVVPVIVTFAVIILIVLLIMILYIRWYRPKRINDDTPPIGPIESKLFKIFSIIDEKICCCKKQDETPKKSDGSHDNNDDPEMTSLLPGGQITNTKDPADMTLIDEGGSDTQLTPAVGFAPQDTNSSDPIPEDKQISIALTSAFEPSSTTLHSLPTPTPEPSSSTSPDAPSRTPSYEPTTPVSIRKDDIPSSIIETEYNTPHDKPVQVSDNLHEEQEHHEPKTKTTGENEPKTKKKKEYKQNRSGDSSQSKGKPKSMPSHRESTKVSDEAKIMLGEAKTKPLPEDNWDDDDDQTEDKTTEQQENPINLPTTHQPADANVATQAEAMNQQPNQATNSSEEPREKMNHLQGQSPTNIPSQNQDKPTANVSPFNKTSPPNDMLPTDNKYQGFPATANGTKPEDVVHDSTNQVPLQEVSPMSMLNDDDVEMEDDTRSDTAEEPELILHSNDNVTHEATEPVTGLINNDGDSVQGSDDEVNIPSNPHPVAPQPNAMAKRGADDLTEMMSTLNI